MARVCVWVSPFFSSEGKLSLSLSLSEGKKTSKKRKKKERKREKSATDALNSSDLFDFSRVLRLKRKEAKKRDQIGGTGEKGLVQRNSLLYKMIDEPFFFSCVIAPPKHPF